ncbi:MAG: hypothetical protein ABFR19_00565 [Pseudomonadota bacterium]
MVDYIDPNKLDDSAIGSLRRELGEQAQLEGQLAELEARLAQLPEQAPALKRAELLLEIARIHQILDRGEEAWPLARTAFELFSSEQQWEHAADACDVLYQSDQPGSLAALANGIWLGVTFPVDPEISVHLLSHIVDDTPDDADGAAVAAVTALYLAEARAMEGAEKERLVFFSNQLLGRVARRHSGVESQQQFSLWIERLELDDPDKFLVRLRNVIDVLAQDDWWIDREAIHQQLEA